MKPNGYIAITSILIIGVIVTLISLVQAFTSINEGQFALVGNNNEKALSLVESCVENALVNLNDHNNLPSSISLPGSGTCTVTTNSNVGTSWDFTVSGTVNTHQKSVQKANPCKSLFHQ